MRNTPAWAISESTRTVVALSATAPPATSMLQSLARWPASAASRSRASRAPSIQASRDGDSRPRYCCFFRFLSTRWRYQ